MSFEERNRIVRDAMYDDDLATIERVHPNAFVLNQQLFRAIEAGNLRDVQTAVEAGVDVNLEKLPEDALLYKMLLNPDLPPTIQNLKSVHIDFFLDQDLPLIAAMRNGNFEIAKYLLENGARVTDNDKDILEVAILYNDKAMIRYLLENPYLWYNPGIEPGYSNWLQTNEIIKNNRLDVMEFLLQNWPTGNFANDHFLRILYGKDFSRGWTTNPSKEMVQLFINNGADVNLRGNSPAHTHDLPLLLVFRRGDIEIFKLLLENGAKVNKSFMTDFQMEVQRTLERLERGHSYAEDQQFIDTLPEFQRIIKQELERIQKEQERQRLEKYKRPSDPSWITSASKYQRYQFEQVLKSFNLSQLKRVYQKVYGKKCPVKTKKAILKILQRK
jgi:ankyrin repeat protein